MIGRIKKLDIGDQNLDVALPEASAWQFLVPARREKGQTSGRLGKKWGALFDLSKYC